MIFFSTEQQRRAMFPVLEQRLFLAHAGVTVLPSVAVQAMHDYLQQCASQQQEFAGVWRMVAQTRALSAQWLGARPAEIALLGPTSLGLSLVANGLSWRAGDEVVYHAQDYPANVYPWINLQRQGVVLKPLQTRQPGEVTVESVEQALTPRTRLVALSSCHFLSGRRLPIDSIGRMLRERGVWFCLDAIQTLGAFPTLVEHVDFLSADSHKWLLGPMAAGLVYVREELQEQLRPSLLGAWNVSSPQFIAQPKIEFEATARRYEPGVLNLVGIAGMKASMELLAQVGIEAIGRQLLALGAELRRGLEPLGFEFLLQADDPLASGIISMRRREGSGPGVAAVVEHLRCRGVDASLRHDHQGAELLRFSPHFYNTTGDMQRVVAEIAAFRS